MSTSTIWDLDDLSNAVNLDLLRTQRGRNALSAVLGIGILELVGRATPPVIPTVGTIFGEFAGLILSGEIPAALAGSLTHMFIGYAIAILLAIPLAFLLAQHTGARWALNPYVDALYATPTISYLPLIIVWFGLHFRARVVLVVLFAFFEIFINVFQGVGTVSDTYRSVAESFDTPLPDLQRLVILPASAPYIFAGLHLGMGRAVRAMITAEIFLAAVNLGEMLTDASAFFDIPGMFAVIVTVTLAGVVFQWLIKYAERLTIPWHFSASGATRSRGLRGGVSSRVKGVLASVIATSFAALYVGTTRLLGLVRSAFDPVFVFAARVWAGRAGTSFNNLDRGRRKQLIQFGTLPVLFVVWEVYAALFGGLVFAGPSTVLPLYVDMAFNSDMLTKFVGVTMKTMLMGYGLAVVFAVPIGLLIGRSRLAEGFISPWVSALFVTSTSALLPLFVTFFGVGTTFLVAIVWISCVWHILLIIYHGSKGINADLIDAGRAFDTPPLKMYKSVILPATFPYVIAGLRMGLARAFRGVILGETFVLIGYGGLIMQYGRESLNLAPVLALIITIMVFAYTLRTGLEKLQSRLIPWADVEIEL